MALLTREQILGSDDIKTEVVDVPEWGGSILIGVMTAKDRDAYDSSTFKVVGKEIKPDLTNARAKLLARCIVDESGKPMFSADELAEKSGNVLDRLAAVARRINGMDDGAIEASVKN